MSSMDEHILKTTKEIVVKIIETGRISPSGFSESFKSIYHTIDETVKGSTGNSRKEELRNDD
ncbi:MAG: conjugal transfer protein TraB [Desulfatirhabdiaceae bacterium]|nr:conjugal transfer protein TraB [Desulfatirhabdiaceae bacterium]